VSLSRILDLGNRFLGVFSQETFTKTPLTHKPHRQYRSEENMSKHATPLLILTLLMPLLIMPVKPVLAATPDTWTTVAPMQVARSKLGVVASGGKIYAIGGSTENGYIPNTVGNNYAEKGWMSNINEEYDPVTDRWVLKQPMPTARYEFAAAAYSNKIYCMGGITNWVSGQVTYTKVNEVYDTATDTWEKKASVPYSPEGQANVVGDKIYLVGGGEAETLNQIYDPETDLWTLGASLPEKVSFQVSVVLDGRIYVTGLYQSLGKESSSSKNYVYDPPSNTWTSCAALPADAFSEAGVPWRGNWSSEGAGATTGANSAKRICVFFTQYVYSGPLPNMVYNAVDDSWDRGADEPTNREGFGVAVLNDMVYLVGGKHLEYPFPDDNYFTVTPLAANERYTPLGYGVPDHSQVKFFDDIAPRITITSPENRTYNENSVLLNFTINEPVDRILYSLDDNQNATISGNITLSGLPNGVHYLVVYANDSSGNAGASETVTFTIAKQDPFPTIPVLIIIVAVIVVAGALLYRKRVRGRTQ
jgi:Kelch motif